MTIYELFSRTHLDYGDVIYDRASNELLIPPNSWISSTAIAITGAMRGSSFEKVFQGLDPETLKSRSRLRKFCRFYKLIK